MIYLTRTTTDRRGIAHTDLSACETVGTTERAEARGFVRCSHAKYMAVWYWNDMRAMTTEPAPLSRAVGAALN